MEVFRRLGFRKNWVYEAVVTTRSKLGDNAAPMGVWSHDLESVKLLVYKSSKTYGSLVKEKKFVINFPEDVTVFYDAVLKKGSLVYSDGTLFLSGCPAAVEAQVSAVRDLGEKAEFSAEVVSWRMEKKPRLVNRADCLALESLIAYSKLSSASGEEKALLSERLAENARVIGKTAPKSVYQRLVGRLR